MTQAERGVNVQLLLVKHSKDPAITPSDFNLDDATQTPHLHPASHNPIIALIELRAKRLLASNNRLTEASDGRRTGYLDGRACRCSRFPDLQRSFLFGNCGADSKGKRAERKNKIPHTGRSPLTVTRVPERVCGQ